MNSDGLRKADIHDRHLAAISISQGVVSSVKPYYFKDYVNLRGSVYCVESETGLNFKTGTSLR